MQLQHRIMQDTILLWMTDEEEMFPLTTAQTAEFQVKLKKHSIKKFSILHGRHLKTNFSDRQDKWFLDFLSNDSNSRILL